MVKIITDSTCDLTKERMEEIGVICVPLTVHIGNDIYLDGVNLSKTEFYEKLRTEKSFPTTAQPTPHTFEEVFTAALEEADEVVCLLISSELSGTVQSANIAKNTMEREEIHILDSRTTCLSLGLLVEIAAQRAKEGKTAAEIMTELEGLTSRVRICAGIETLEYLKKGGRITPAAAALGTLLKLKPVLQIQGEKLDAFAKARTVKQAKNIMIKQIKDDCERRFGSADGTGVHISMTSNSTSAFRAISLASSTSF